MEQSSQMSAEQSLKLINETLRDSRLVITKRSGSHFILWGAILTLIALAHQSIRAPRTRAPDDPNRNQAVLEVDG